MRPIRVDDEKLLDYLRAGPGVGVNRGRVVPPWPLCHRSRVVCGSQENTPHNQIICLFQTVLEDTYLSPGWIRYLHGEISGTLKILRAVNYKATDHRVFISHRTRTKGNHRSDHALRNA